MKLITPKQSAEADRISINEYGYDIMSLIESAAAKLCDHLDRFKSVTVVAGPGNNGGDGILAAAKLAELGVKTELFVFKLGGEKHFSENCRKLLKIAEAAGVKIICFGGENSGNINEDVSICLAESLEKSECAIDAVLGTGYSPDKERTTDCDLDAVLTLINSHARFVCAADIPSGVDGATGRARKSAVRADETVTFSYAKPGHFINPGKKLTGKLFVESILVPDAAYLEAQKRVIGTFSVNGRNESDIAQMCLKLPKRDGFSHKGNFGKVMIIGGSEGMTGAPCLAAESSLMSGAGLCYMAAPRGLLGTFSVLVPEAVKLPCGSKDDVFITKEHISEIKSEIESMDAVVLGPGLGRNEESAGAVQMVIDTLAAARKNGKNISLVLDADALYFLGTGKVSVPEDFGEFIVTPHEAEAARLLGCKTSDVSDSRLQSAKNISEKYGCIVILKGNDTIITGPSGDVSVNDTGNCGMATAGSGDVLSGIAGALSAVTDGFGAAEEAVYIHGLAGDDAKERLTEYSVTSKEILRSIPAAFKKLLIFSDKGI